MITLSEKFSVLAESKNPEKDFLYTPSILKTNSGRYVVSYDVSCKTGIICISDNKGKTWKQVAEREFRHARLFSDGDRIYLIGHSKDIIIFYSDNDGESWSDGSFLTTDEAWHQSACSVWYKGGYVYLVMEIGYTEADEDEFVFWKPNILAPVMMRGKLGTDLTKRENWLFSERKRFRDIIKSEDSINWIGVPFFTQGGKGVVGVSDVDEYRKSFDFAKNKEGKPFYTDPIGWLETNVVQITDPHHYWYDETGNTLHLFMRAHTGGSGYCFVMKAVERMRDGKPVIDIECEKNPSGKEVLFLPMPGGQMKFFVKYDDKTKLYWLVSTQATDTMCRIEHLSKDRYNIPCDERDRLVLHYSKNMVDWCFAGMVSKGNSSKESRHYASMDIDGNDIIIVSRSGNSAAKDAHCGNLITFHRIKNFRKLIY